MQDAMGKVNKFSNAAIKKLGPKKSNKHLSSNGQELAELVREATGKALNRPDPELNQQVCTTGEKPSPLSSKYRPCAGL